MELGITTFAETIPDHDSDEAVGHGEHLRQVIREAEVADEVSLDVIGLGQHHRPDHVGAFEHEASTLFAMGYDEIGVYYPVDAQRDVCEAVAATVMPGLRDC